MFHIAAYDYYRHGPLTKTITGQQQIQSVTNIYTLQGWLKGTLEGDDSDSYIAKQAFNFGIHYFEGDYTTINGSTPFASTHLPSGVSGGSLYNGNISAMKIAIPKIGEPVLHTYKYDQLNRIKEVNNYNSYNPGTNTWTGTNAHKELLSFDANGNIQTALLNGSSASLPYQNLAYTYDGVKKNRLLSIHNSVGNVTSEYEYDAIGNVTKDELEGNENMEWNVYGKLKSLEKVGSGTAISFGYDASGNRISKKVGTTKQQWYVRDASGNIMATYIKENAINGGDLSTEMFNMYGSSMLGGWKLSVNIETMPPPANNGELERGNQEFYFSNHLGNNLVILSDRKEGIQDTGNPTQVTGYEPYVLSATDYSAYGENLIGREYNPGKIKFGFNGKWNDFETGYQDYGMRMYSVRARRFPSEDPITEEYPELTPYQFASNRPVDGIDLDGLEFISHFRNSQAKYFAAQNELFLKSQREIYEEKQRASIRKVPVKVSNVSQAKKPSAAERERNKNLAAAYKAAHPAPTKLEENKHFQKLAENIALPMVEAAVLDGVASLFFRSFKLFSLNKSFSKDAASMARASQGNTTYPGVDSWRNITLNDGSYVVGGLPGQGHFYTTISGLNRSKMNQSELWKGLQVIPSQTEGYRPLVGIYEVTGNTKAAFGTTYANRMVSGGDGGLPQIFVPDLSKLKLVTQLPLKKP